MKNITTISQATAYLEKIFATLNRDKFNGELPSPMVTIQSNKDTMGHCTMCQVWQSADGGQWEINLSAEYLNLSINDTVDTLLHEMVHLLCRVRGTQETSRGGYYHNQRFKDIAVSVGLTVTYSKKYGWGDTQPSEDLKVYIQKKGWSNIPFSRITSDAGAGAGAGGGNGNGEENTDRQKKKSSTRKYSCPCCGQSIRATKVVNILCMDCNKQMVTE